MKMLIGILAALLLYGSQLTAQQPVFSQDSAYAYLKHLAVTIGPRTMGSGGEREALDWAAGKFRSFGADTAYVMRFDRTPRGTNTSSGIAVGVFRGELDSIIVVGGHIDSDRPDNPGASDNASGTATTIELARQWSRLDRRYTMLFAAFGGEERGLIGSKHFVNNFADIDKVSLMFSIDMAGSEGWLIPFIDIKGHQSPEWLVQDAYAADDALGYNSLEYPAHFFSLNSALGGAGSDHMPFMEKEIPAIDFTAGINIDPIHTPQDDIRFTKPAMLKRSGELVHELVRKYQQDGVPATKTGHYMMLDLFGMLWFIPNWMIWFTLVLAVVVGNLVWLQSRKMRQEVQRQNRARVPGLKLLFLLLIVAMSMQMGEILLELLTAKRYPWLTHYYSYLWYALPWALTGLWGGLYLTRRWKFTPDSHGYAARAILVSILFVAAMAFLSPRLALYPALSLLIFSIAMALPGTWPRVIVGLLAPLPMMRLMFMETLPFLARSMTRGGMAMDSFWADLRVFLILGAVIAIWYYPSMLMYGYLATNEAPLKSLLKKFRSTPVGLALVLIIVVYGGYLMSIPAYSDKWRPEVRVLATYDTRTGQDSLIVKGNDFLKNMYVVGESFRQNLDTRDVAVGIALPFKADWLTIDGSDSLIQGEMDTLNIAWRLISRKQLFRAFVALEADTLGIEGVLTDLGYRRTGNSLRFNWYSEPRDTLHLKAKIIMQPGTRLIRSVEGHYLELPLKVEVVAEHAAVHSLTEVTYQDTLLVRWAESGQGPMVLTDVAEEYR